MRLSRSPYAPSLIIVAFATLIATLPAIAGNSKIRSTNPDAGEQVRQQAANHTQALIALQKRWEKAQGIEKSRVLTKMIAKAKERRNFLLKLVETNPAEVLRAVIPQEKQLGMPAEVIEKLEQKLELEGELESTYLDNFENPVLSRLKHELKTPFGEHFELYFAGDRPDLPFGAKVKANGLLLGSDGEDSDTSSVIVGSLNDEEYPIAYAGADGTINTSLRTFANDTFGEVRTLVILVNFQDKREQPYTQSFARDMVFNQVNAYFKENSYGQSWLAGDVTPWMTLPVSYTDSGVCTGASIYEHGDIAAQNAGYDIAQYDRLVYVFPSAPCGHTGAAQIGGTRSRINGHLTLETTAHELGHNYGLSHSKSLYCDNNTTIGEGSPDMTSWTQKWANCKEAEYGNTVDVMGASPSAHFHASQKELLGWLEYGSSPDITEITQSGRYEIDVMASQLSSGRPKALKVLKAVNPDNGWKIWYYLEFRQPVGFDSILGKSYTISNVYPTNVTNGVIIHAIYGPATSVQWLLDMTPETTMLYPRDPALEVGKTFYSPDGDVSITTDWVDSTKAIVDITVGNSGSSTQTCTRARPGLSLGPAQAPWVAAGTDVSYTVTVSNNDSSACSNSSYSLSTIAPSNWSATFGNTSLTLAPGESASTTMSVASPSTASDGFYDISVTATSGSYSAIGSVTYVVDNPEISTNSPPIALSDSAQSTQDTSVTINVIANDSDPDGDALSVNSYTQAVHGTLLLVGDVFTYTPDIGFSGNDSFTYTVSDGNGGSDSAFVSINVIAVTSNQAPVAVDDSATTDKNSSVTIAVLSNDSDPDGDTLKITGVTQGSKGTVKINTDGTLTFTPAKNFKNSDSFSYTISDGKMSASATVTISLTSSGGSNVPGKGNGKGSK